MSSNDFQKLTSVITKLTNAASKGMTKANTKITQHTDMSELPRILNKKFSGLRATGEIE